LKYLLDTNICIAIINRKGDQILNRVKLCTVGDIGVSSITAAELIYGAEKSGSPERNKVALELFFATLTIMEFDEKAAQVYGKVRATLEKAGTPIGSLDTLIAAHALALMTVLVTNNTREFSRVPNLRIEDWLK
jgi:tRNA(fMet)-specific endonuclease VapC